ncbi:hypothetical protein CCGE525_28455 (plasmid) [Rhizobium jaguaris]|uniref:Uncharacterized protein n=1 Tax=Rhizobium jaguaris TaxID=1312183 RepID=A0A387FY78_9HYPH|nr:hypothetical protein CCGE525_28455 [Rhizobium jaguaris]
MGTLRFGVGRVLHEAAPAQFFKCNRVAFLGMRLEPRPVYLIGYARHCFLGGNFGGAMDVMIGAICNSDGMFRQ